MTKKRKKYFPNNIKYWNSQEATDNLTSATIEDVTHDVSVFELGRPYCCIIRTKDINGKVKEYAYKQMKSAEKKLVQLASVEPEIVEYTVADECTVTLIQ